MRAIPTLRAIVLRAFTFLLLQVQGGHESDLFILLKTPVVVTIKDLGSAELHVLVSAALHKMSQRSDL